MHGAAWAQPKAPGQRALRALRCPHLHEDVVDQEGPAVEDVLLRLFEREALRVPAQQALHLHTIAPHSAAGEPGAGSLSADYTQAQLHA